MTNKRFPFLVIVVSVLLCSACSQAPSENAKSSSPKGDTKAAKTSAADDTCKDFPVAIYPSHTSLSCETGAGQPLRQTAYIDAVDPVPTVAAFYKTQVQATDWKVDPVEVESPTHTVVSMKKGIGYATAVINAGPNGNGSSIQIHAYPNGS